MGYKYSKYNVLIKDVFENTSLLYNVLTESMIELTPDDVCFFSSCLSSSAFTDSQFSILTKNGFIISERYDELAFLRYAHKERCYDSNQMGITIAPTMACNMSCIYCFEKHSNITMTKEVKEQLYIYVTNLIKKVGTKDLHISWFGGEPLLCWDIISELSRKLIIFCEQNGIVYSASIITNGFLLSPAIINDMKEFLIKSVQITIDGDETTHNQRKKLLNGNGTYAEITNNIHLFSDTPIQVSIRVNIDQSNTNAYETVRQMSKEYQNGNIMVYPALTEYFPNSDESIQNSVLRRDNFSQIVINEYLTNNPEEISWKGKFFACQAEVKYSFAVDSKGFLYKCWNQLGEEEQAYSNVFNDNKVIVENIVPYMGVDILDDEECRNCLILPLCFGGCPYLRRTRPYKPCPPEKYCLEEKIIQYYQKQKKKNK